jgi:hypothetical protein
MVMDAPREAATAADAAIQESAPLSFVGPVRLIPGENAASYDELLARMTGALKPADAVEEVWVRDLVDVVWDVLRLRRLKASLLAGCADEGLCSVLEVLDLRQPYQTSRSWAARDPAAAEQVEAALAGAGMSMDTVMARTLAERMDDIVCIDRMTHAAQVRRDGILREIDRYRAGFAQRLCRAAGEPGTAQLDVIETAPALAAE